MKRRQTSEHGPFVSVFVTCISDEASNDYMLSIVVVEVMRSIARHIINHDIESTIFAFSVNTLLCREFELVDNRTRPFPIYRR